MVSLNNRETHAQNKKDITANLSKPVKHQKQKDYLLGLK